MGSEKELEEEVVVEGQNWKARLRQSSLSAGLRLIDAISGVLSRLRERLAAASGDADASGDDRRRPQARTDDGASEPVAHSRPGRLVYFLSLVMILLIGAMVGATFSYRLLSKSIDTTGVSNERLREDFAQLKKQESRTLKQFAETKQTLNTYKEDALEYAKEIEGLKTEAEELHRQLSVYTGIRREPASQPGQSGRSAGAGAAAKRPMTDKVEDCTMDSANVAADLERCMNQARRK